MPGSETGVQGKVCHKDKGDTTVECVGGKIKKPINQAGLSQLDSEWLSSGKQEAERTLIILETSPTDGQRSTIQRTVFITQPGVRKNAEAFCVGIVLEREQQWLLGPLLMGRRDPERMASPGSATNYGTLGISLKLYLSFSSFVTKDHF